MRNLRIVVGMLAAATALATVASAGTGAAAPSRDIHRNDHACSQAARGSAACTAIRHDTLTPAGKHVHHTSPSGYGPADIQSAYQLSGLASGAKTVAIVDAYDDPRAEADLNVYRSQYSLPACTTANGCFTKVNQTGGTKYPPRDGGWAEEISLDLDMVSATCPDCHILLVEATTPSFSDLGAAVNYAASVPGVAAISNSYGGADTTQVAAAYNHPGIAVTASTGDSGYGVESPASFQTVVAVGGTSLKKANNSRGWSETAWNGAGSGCSTLNAKPTWQTAATQCSGKANADVSAVADPNTGVAVYDSVAFQGFSGWLVFGGTSVSSPIIAGVYALSGNTAGYPASFTWGHAGSLNDVTSGSNGSCPVSVWCRAGSGWDGPTGLGTPKGTAGF